MKYIIKSLIFLIMMLFPNIVWADFFGGGSGWSDYICRWDECSIEQWITQTFDTLNNVEQERPLSVFVIDIVLYVLTFLGLVWIVIIIYAWFNILISGWDEEKVKPSRKTIVYVLIGLVIIFLAYSIVLFLIKEILFAPPIT